MNIPEKVSFVWGAPFNDERKRAYCQAVNSLIDCVEKLSDDTDGEYRELSKRLKVLEKNYRCVATGILDERIKALEDMVWVRVDPASPKKNQPNSCAYCERDIRNGGTCSALHWTSECFSAIEKKTDVSWEIKKIKALLDRVGAAL